MQVELTEKFINYSYSIVNMITTIQLREDVKQELDKLKESKKETYEDVILNLMKVAEEQIRKQKKLLAEGYKEMAEESLRITKEWEKVDMDWD